LIFDRHTRPLASFADIWTNWTSVRKVREGETTNDIFAFLTAEPNAETTAAGDGGGTRRTRQRGRGIPVGSNRSAVRHPRFAMETVETSADRECPLIELVG
jgi:hypothetical protein